MKKEIVVPEWVEALVVLACVIGIPFIVLLVLS